MNTVVADCQGGAVKPARLVPELILTVRRIVPGAVVERCCHWAKALIHLQLRLRLKYLLRCRRIWSLILPFQGGISDEKIIYKELPANIDGNKRRRFFQVGYRKRFQAVFDDVLRRPGAFYLYAIMQFHLGHTPDWLEFAHFQRVDLEGAGFSGKLQRPVRYIVYDPHRHAHRASVAEDLRGSPIHRYLQLHNAFFPLQRSGLAQSTQLVLMIGTPIRAVNGFISYRFFGEATGLLSMIIGVSIKIDTWREEQFKARFVTLVLDDIVYHTAHIHRSRVIYTDGMRAVAVDNCNIVFHRRSSQRCSFWRNLPLQWSIRTSCTTVQYTTVPRPAISGSNQRRQYRLIADKTHPCLFCAIFRFFRSATASSV